MSVQHLPSYTDLADLLERLPVLVRETRRRKGLSLRQAEAECGVSTGTLSRFEAGRLDCSLRNAQRLLRWLGT